MLMKFKRSKIVELQNSIIDTYRANLAPALDRPKNRGNLTKKQFELLMGGFEDGVRSMSNGLVDALVSEHFIEIED